MTLFKKYKQQLMTLSLGFLFPSFIISILLAFKGIWWKSDTSILASDSFHQYVIFNQTLRNILHGDGSLFYTFTGGLGLNFYALSSYYLGSFLSPFVFFFDLKSMPDAMYSFTIVKFGLIGLSTSFSLSSIYKSLHRWFILLLSTSFALMSFLTSQLEINIWLDVFILIPLILLGIYRLITEGKSVLYFFSLMFLFIQNYYFGYMTAIFLVFWALILVSWDIKKRIKKLIDFTIVSILSTLSSMVMLLPAFLDLQTHGETFTNIVNLKTEDSWYLDLFAKNLIGGYDTTKFGAIPMIYVGLIPLILTILFFTIKSINWKVKLTYAIFISFLIASFYLQPLDLFWQGMHAPNMFLHRYAWIFSTLLIYMAAETLTHITEIKKNQLFFSFIILFTGFSVTYYFRDHYSFLENIHFFLTLEFLIAYYILWFIFVKKKVDVPIFALTCLGFALFEIGIHTGYQIDGLGDEWNFPSRSNYGHQLTEIDNLVNFTKKENSSFYRMEKLNPQTGNDSMKYNYNGISQFSSIRNRSSSSTLDKLGFRSDGTNLNLRYQNNTLIADSLFAIKYNLAESDPLKYGFSPVKTDKGLTLYKNSNSSQLAILTDKVYKDVNFTNLTLDNQTDFINQLTGLDEKYYSTIPPLSSENGMRLGNRITVNSLKNEEMARVNYTLKIPSNTQLYLNLPNIRFTNENSESVQITVNNLSSNFTVDDAFSFFNVGYFKEEKEVRVAITFPGNQQVSFDSPTFYRLDTVAYQKAVDVLNHKKVTVTTKKNTITTHYETKKSTSLLFTLPYDKGWSASQNGKRISIHRAQDGFMKVDVEKGKGTIKLTFVPQGFTIGILCLFLGILLFISYLYLKQRRSHDK